MYNAACFLTREAFRQSSSFERSSLKVASESRHLSRLLQKRLFSRAVLGKLRTAHQRSRIEEYAFCKCCSLRARSLFGQPREDVARAASEVSRGGLGPQSSRDSLRLRPPLALYPRVDLKESLLAGNKCWGSGHETEHLALSCVQVVHKWGEIIIEIISCIILSPRNPGGFNVVVWYPGENSRKEARTNNKFPCNPYVSQADTLRILVVYNSVV